MSTPPGVAVTRFFFAVTQKKTAVTFFFLLIFKKQIKYAPRSGPKITICIIVHDMITKIICLFLLLYKVTMLHNLYIFDICNE